MLGWLLLLYTLSEGELWPRYMHLVPVAFYMMPLLLCMQGMTPAGMAAMVHMEATLLLTHMPLATAMVAHLQPWTPTQR
jgi:hypothetical protein